MSWGHAWYAISKLPFHCFTSFRHVQDRYLNRRFCLLICLSVHRTLFCSIPTQFGRWWIRWYWWMRQSLSQLGSGNWCWKRLWRRGGNSIQRGFNRLCGFLLRLFSNGYGIVDQPRLTTSVRQRRRGIRVTSVVLERERIRKIEVFIFACNYFQYKIRKRI